MRYMADCRKYPSESNCSLTITGERDEVIRAATEHAVSVHGHEDTPELREQLAGMLEQEPVSPSNRSVGGLVVPWRPAPAAKRCAPASAPAMTCCPWANSLASAVRTSAPSAS